MPLIATDTPRFSDVVKHEYEPTLGFCREVVTVRLAADTTLKLGHVLGYNGTAGKFEIATATGAGGASTAAGIALEEKFIPANTDVKVLALVRGQAIVSKGGLVLDSSFDTTEEKAAIYAALTSRSILVNDTI